LALPFCSVLAQQAENYPSRGIKMVIPYPAGGGTDTLGRLVANRLEGKWKQPVTVENRVGASGNIGGDFVAKSPADGYTIMTGITAMIQAPHILPSMPFDPLTAFIPVNVIARSTNLLMVPSSTPANNLKEFLALVKANPDKYNYGSYGNGTSAHIHGEMLKAQTGLNMLHVPYKGGAPLMNDLLGGQITSGFVDITSARGHLKTGKFKILAVTGASRNPLLPDVPTFTELGYKSFEPYGWFAIFVPANTPKDIVNKLSNEISDYIKSPEGTAKIEALGLQPGGEKAEEFARIVREDYRIWGRVIKEAKIKLD
jgi:tripartite-type tricarboxylate transporter receptor subunit TctC